MIVERMVVDDVETPSPSWAVVEKAINRLNGEDVSNVFLSSRAEFPWLSISGGKDGYVTVQIASDVGALCTLRSADSKPSHMSMVMAGQRVSLSGEEFIPKAVALAAAKCFFERGIADPGLTWDSA